MNIKTNHRCKSEVEACKPTAEATYFHCLVAFLFESLFRLVIAAVARLSVLCMPPEGRGAAYCNCCYIYLLPEIAEFCDFLPAERSRCGPVILKVRDIVQFDPTLIYQEISRPQWWPVKAVGCSVGTTFVTSRPLVQNM